MKQSVKIESSIEFMLIGHIAGNDGIIIQSNKLSIENIGMANVVYRSGGEALKDIDNMINGTKFNYIWSSQLKLNSRESKLLFCWEINDKAYHIRTKKGARKTIDKDSYFHILLRDFIENSHQALRELVGYEDYRHRTIEAYRDFLSWRISPLLFKCAIDLENY